MNKLVLGILLPLLCFDYLQAANIDRDELDRRILEIMDNARTPGLAVAIVEDGRIIYEAGYGYRDLDRRIPLSPNSAMGVGSVTKAFTATLLAKILGDKISAPVISYLPEFRMDNEASTESVTMIDLLSHRSGLASHFRLSQSGLERSELLSRLPHLGTNAAPGETWSYNNNAYAIAAAIAERLTGNSWEELIETEILAPLGMTRSFMTLGERCQDELSSSGYQRDAAFEIELSACEDTLPDYMGPAGSMGSTVADMAKWLMAHMAQQPLSQIGMDPSSAAALQSPVTELNWIYEPIVPGASVPMITELQYGLGWIHARYLDRRWIWHGGNIDGVAAHVSYMPDEKIGVVVLQNTSYSSAEMAVAFTIYDMLLDSSLGLDWSHGYPWDRSIFQRPELSDILPLTALTSAYIGHFYHPGYGLLRISDDAHRLFIHYGEISKELHHIGDDNFEYIFGEKGWMATKHTCKIELVDSFAAQVLCDWEPSIGQVVFNRIQ